MKALATVGNFPLFSKLITKWSDASLAARDAKARKTEAVVAAVDNMTCVDSPRALLALKCNFME